MMRNVTEDDIGLKVLYELEPELQDAVPGPSVDILAIHGIGAHPDETWCKKVDADTPKERYVNWLSDLQMLPAVVPQARIMRYGYQSQWFGEETIGIKASTVAQRLLLSLQRERKECPSRPLIFVAHCFGGLVILKAIVDAKRSEKKWPGIFQSTVGMLFFGTPFRGAGGLNQSEMVRAIQSQYDNDQILASNLNILAPGNESLMDLMEMFFETRQERHLAGVACFFEQKPSNVGAIYRGARNQKFVVDESSGCLDQSESTAKFSLSRNHFNMNKFGRPTEEDFLTVREVIRSIVARGPGLLMARNPECDEFRVRFHLTGLPVTSRFIRRDAEITEMEERLCPNCGAKKRKIYVLHGLGGVGKTQLAVAFARKHQETFSAILWLNGNSNDTLIQSLAAFGRHAGIVRPLESTATVNQRAQDEKEEAHTVLRWLSLEKNHGWLAIFDNVDREYPSRTGDHQAYDIMSFLPTADHGSILITTRLASLGEVGIPKKVQRLNRGQALELLGDHSGLSSSTQDMAKLADRLGCLPLALVQAGRYLRETGTSCTTYLTLYERSWSGLAAEVPQLRDYANGCIQTTWTISYDQVKEIDVTAAQLLQLWAFLDHQAVWYELFLRGSRGCTECRWLQELVQSEIAFKRAIRTLLGYSLIEPYRDLSAAEGHPSGENYSMHPVVHDWCQELVIEKKAEWATLAFLVVGFAIASDHEAQYWLQQQRLVPHADRCIAHVRVGILLDGHEDGLVNDASHMFGLLYADQGKLVEAEEMFRRALTGKEKAWGSDHTSTLSTVNNLGNLYKNQGKLVEAEEMYRRALAGKEKAWGPDHTSTLDTVNNLGNLYMNQGKLVEAEEIYKRALAGYEKALGPDHTSTLNTVNNLGNFYKNQSKLVEAEEMYKRALAGYEKAWGPDHTSTLDIVNNLGLLYADQGKLVEAEEIYKRALTGKEKAWGPDHISTLSTVNNLGNLYTNQSKLVEAEEMFRRALTGKEKVWGSDHTSTLSTVNNLGNLYKNQGKLMEAEEMYRRALAGKEKAWGPDHTSTLDTVNNLGALYINQGKLMEAKEMFRRALVGYEKAWGPDHTFTLSTVNNLGVFYADQGKLVEAEEMFKRALAGYEKAWGPDHSSTRLTARNLSLLRERKSTPK